MGGVKRLCYVDAVLTFCVGDTTDKLAGDIWEYTSSTTVILLSSRCGMGDWR